MYIVTNPRHIAPHSPINFHLQKLKASATLWFWFLIAVCCFHRYLVYLLTGCGWRQPASSYDSKHVMHSFAFTGYSVCSGFVLCCFACLCLRCVSPLGYRKSIEHYQNNFQVQNLTLRNVCKGQKPIDWSIDKLTDWWLIGNCVEMFGHM